MSWKTKQTQALPNKKPQINYMKYAGMATQLFGIMIALLWIGHKIDAYRGASKPYLTMLLPIIGLVGYLYKLVKELS